MSVMVIGNERWLFHLSSTRIRIKGCPRHILLKVLSTISSLKTPILHCLVVEIGLPWTRSTKTRVTVIASLNILELVTNNDYQSDFSQLVENLFEEDMTEQQPNDENADFAFSPGFNWMGQNALKESKLKCTAAINFR